MYGNPFSQLSFQYWNLVLICLMLEKECSEHVTIVLQNTRNKHHHSFQKSVGNLSYVKSNFNFHSFSSYLLQYLCLSEKQQCEQTLIYIQLASKHATKQQYYIDINFCCCVCNFRYFSIFFPYICESTHLNLRMDLI